MRTRLTCTLLVCLVKRINPNPSEDSELTRRGLTSNSLDNLTRAISLHLIASALFGKLLAFLPTFDKLPLRLGLRRGFEEPELVTSFRDKVYGRLAGCYAVSNCETCSD